MTDYVKEFENVISIVSHDLGKPIDISRICIRDRGVPHQAPRWV